MAGKCEGVITSVQLRIPCPCVGFQGLSQPGQLDVPCIVCGHPLSQHRSTSLADLQPEMNDITPLQKREADISMNPRSDTTEKLADLIDKRSVVHVRGTPACGKTTLAHLLRRYYASKGRHVCFISAWIDLSTYIPRAAGSGAFDLLAQVLHERKAGPADYIIPGTIILVDEAQVSYSDQLFWNDIIKELIQGRCPEDIDIKLCLFSSYGSPITGVEHVIYTPATFKAKQRVNFTIQPGGPPLGIFFTEAESYNTIDQIIEYGHSQRIVTFDNHAKNYLFSLTNGHPSGLKALVDFIITEKDVWTFLKEADVYRSFPKHTQMIPETREILAKVLEQGSIAYNKTDEHMKTCYQSGWLHKTLKNDDDDTEVCVLASRLHEKQESLIIYPKYLECIMLTNYRWVENIIGGERKPLPLQFQTLQQLVMPILRGFSTINLKNSFEGKILSSAARYRPVEAQYQDEFYRSFNQVVGTGVPISSEWSRTSQGRIDFWIPERRWAIELLRDHNEINEHIARFHMGGKYYNWIMDSTIRDWMVINCAITIPKKG
ncbi:hypothetical protein BJX63DRAFT_418092 [Aspergillus granulosus]|uniref:AAA+ ATPase domain-containing protein n=1 Tax=Aspergillus granulosus TaxID=176169 RepID=A0ABR4HZY0_9EURO